MLDNAQPEALRLPSGQDLPINIFYGHRSALRGTFRGGIAGVYNALKQHRSALRGTSRFGFAGVPNAPNIELSLF